ncbi:MAG: SDR family NAD(P)-dependent oxidoreductase, partial [Sulfitobacter sp.]
MEFTGKTAIVTGGGRDIGRACAIRLAEGGANVAINYHSSSSGAESAVAEIKAAGGNAFALQGDMTNAADVARLVSETQSQFGASIDVLVHVTGGLVARKTIAEAGIDHWNAVMDLNVTSFFLITKETAPHMPAGSSIVSFASQAGRDGGGPGA